MPEPLSIAFTNCLVGYAALNAYTRNHSAVSDEAKTAMSAASAVMSSAENSHALFGAKAVALNEMRTLAEECAHDDWDGNGAAGIDVVTVWNVEDFIRALPNDFPLPEFAPEPDGSISLDWIKSRFRLFSLSIGGSNRVAYAWIDGTDKGHGVAFFDGTNVPVRVLAEIRPIVNYGNITLRAA